MVAAGRRHDDRLLLAGGHAGRLVPPERVIAEWRVGWERTVDRHGGAVLERELAATEWGRGDTRPHHDRAEPRGLADDLAYPRDRRLRHLVLPPRDVEPARLDAPRVSHRPRLLGGRSDHGRARSPPRPAARPSRHRVSHRAIGTREQRGGAGCGEASRLGAEVHEQTHRATVHYERRRPIVGVDRDAIETRIAELGMEAAQCDEGGVPREQRPVRLAVGLVPHELRREERGDVLRIGHVVRRPTECRELVPPAVAHRSPELGGVIGEVLERCGRAPLLALEEHRDEG